MRNLVLVVVTMMCIISCNQYTVPTHLGEDNSCACKVNIDTITITLNSGSGIGNFYMVDSTITFVDALTCTFHDIDVNGKITQSYFRRGNGKNELPNLLYAYPVENDSLNRVVILDNSNGLTLFDATTKQIVKRSIVDFDWNDRSSYSYSSPSLYNFAFFTDFGVSYYLDSDSNLLFQTNVINRSTKTPDSIESNRYDKAAILGKLNIETLHVEEVLGHFPDIYKSKPMPHLEFFQYFVEEDRLYVNHTVDSLIYVYQYPDKLLHTIGFECRDIDRNYSITKDIDNGYYFKKDLSHVGFNTGLKFIPELDIICRTYIKTASTGESGMQIYRNNNLIADVNVPDFFKLLGYYGGDFYGSSFIPIENENSVKIVIYRLNIMLN